MTDPERIADNLARIRDRIGQAATRSGRSPDEVLLLPITKYVGSDVAATFVDLGITQLGESRPQQLWEKAAAIPGVRWHLVGHLQRNKLRRTLPLVSLIHSVDSIRLLEAIERQAAEQGEPARVLLEVNTSGESAKHGFAPGDLPATLEVCGQYEHLAVEGLMTMAPQGGGDAARRSFATLRELRDDLNRRLPEISLPHLSMGMSGDFEEAIAEQATIVRIGSLLFENPA